MEQRKVVLEYLILLLIICRLKRNVFANNYFV
jgi:hypothetical protein